MRRRRLIASLATLLAACAHGVTRSPDRAAAPGTPGYLVVAGGGRLGPEIVARFVELAGGPDAEIVVIPTAGDDSTYDAQWPGLAVLRDAGARHLVVRHTRDRRVADADSFVAPIRTARGVWFPGGRQWRLVDSYLNTRTERALHDLLARGGVIGGTSAGASIQASYLVRGAREGNAIMMAPGYEQGFGFLTGAAVDQHVAQRKRERDLHPVVVAHPDLLGFGLDEGTAIIVHGTRAQVVGRGHLYVHNGRDPLGADSIYTVLTSGDVFDLTSRHRVTAGRTRPE